MANRSEFSNGETSRPGHQILVKALDGSLASQPALFHAAEGGRGLVNYIKALIDLYRLDGSLLERRGIAAPGREPVQLQKMK